MTCSIDHNNKELTDVEELFGQPVFLSHKIFWLNLFRWLAPFNKRQQYSNILGKLPKHFIKKDRCLDSF